MPGCCRRLGLVGLVHLPLSAVPALGREVALGHRVVLHDDVLDDGADPMRANADAPAFICHDVVYALPARVTRRLHGVACEGAASCSPVASPYVHGVCRVPEVVGARELPRLGSLVVRAWRYRQA